MGWLTTPWTDTYTLWSSPLPDPIPLVTFVLVMTALILTVVLFDELRPHD